MTGWYQYGPAPGQRGPAVILGHVDSATAISVSYHLKDLRRGDRICITQVDGKVAAFAVDGVQKAAKDAFPTAAVYAEGRLSCAAIITVLVCTGAREEECACLDAEDTAVTGRPGTVRLSGKGDEAREVALPTIARDRINAWLDERGRHPGPLWPGPRAPADNLRDRPGRAEISQPYGISAALSASVLMWLARRASAPSRAQATAGELSRGR